MDSVFRLSMKLVNNLERVGSTQSTRTSIRKTLGYREITRNIGFESWSCVKKCRIAVVGLGGVGQSLAHLLTMYPAGFTELRLCNRSDPAGLVEELTHIPTAINVSVFKGVDRLADGLKDVEVVVVSAGIPRKTDAPRQQLFRDNAELCREIVTCIAENCPNAMIAMVSNPLNSLVPVAAEVLKQNGAYHASRLFGICELDTMRSRHYYGEMIGRESSCTYVPVVGGHSEYTTVPLFSRARPRVCLSDAEIDELTMKVREAGKRVVSAKKGTGGSTWSMASAALYFVHQLSRALNNEPHIIVSAYVESDVTDSRFFSNELLLGPEGIERNFGYGKVTNYEGELIDDAVKILRKDISMAEDFVKNSDDNNNKCKNE